MICYVYRSKAKAEAYLYLSKKDDFDCLPDSLKKIFGQPEFSMVVNLAKRDKLARVDIDEVKDKLEEQGFFLQLPPTVLSDQNELGAS